MKLGRIILPLVAVTATIGSADINSAKLLMGECLQHLGDEPVYTLHKTGTEDYNGTITNLESVLVIKNVSVTPGIYTYLIEYRSFRNGVIVNRAAIDGTRVWFYDIATKTYSSSNYYNVPDANKPSVVFRTLSKLVSGEDQFMMQLAQQAFEASLNGRASAAAKWLPWMPVYSSLNDSPSGVQVESTVPNYRYVDYQTSFVAGENLLIRAVGHTELNRPGRYVVNDWNIEILASEFAGSSYTFAPPAGARAVATTTIQGG